MKLSPNGLADVGSLLYTAQLHIAFVRFTIVLVFSNNVLRFVDIIFVAEEFCQVYNGTPCICRFCFVARLSSMQLCFLRSNPSFLSLTTAIFSLPSSYLSLLPSSSSWLFLAFLVYRYNGFSRHEVLTLWSLTFPFFRYIRDYALYLDARQFANVHATDRALIGCYRHNILCDTNVGVCVRSWPNSGGRGMSALRSYSPEGNCPLVRVYEQVECINELWMFVQRLDGQLGIIVGSSLIVMSCCLSHQYFY